MKEELQLKIVKRNGCAIQFINNPSEKIKLEAVKQNGRAIKFINNPSEKIKLEAVKNRGDAIEYVENPSESIKWEAIKEFPPSIGYIKNPSSEMLLKATIKWCKRFINKGFSKSKPKLRTMKYKKYLNYVELIFNNKKYTVINYGNNNQLSIELNYKFTYEEI